MGCSLLLMPEERALHQENPKILSTWTFLVMMGLKICPVPARPLFIPVFQHEMPSADDPAVL